MADLTANRDPRLALAPTELAAWRGFLRVQSTVLRELSAELEHEHGLNLSAYEVLLFLEQAPQRQLRMSELAASVLLSPSGVTRLVDRLAADGLVAKSRCAEDRRGSWATITDAGVGRLQAARRTHLAGVRSRFLAPLSDADQDALAQIWEQILPGSAHGSAVHGSR
jgi:DNA-binding MarR family transcriptional regulator